MKTSTKAILLSALVYPGAGQLYLKTYLVATALIAATTAALYVLLVPIVTITNEIAARLLSGELQAGSDLLTEVLVAAQHESAMQSMNLTSLVLFGLWLSGVIHAWRVGRRQDDQTHPR